MADDRVFVDRRVGMSRVLRDWAGDSWLRRGLALLLQFGPVLLGAGFLPTAIDGSVLARVVVGLVVVFVVTYKVLDVRITDRDDPSKRSR